MQDDLVFWLWLTQVRGVGAKTSKKLLERFASPRAVYDASEEELLTISCIGQKLAGAIREHRSLRAAEELLAKAAKHDVQVLTIWDTCYPLAVKNLPNAPIILYYKGTLRQERGIAIIGARRCTQYAKRVTSEAAHYLATNNIPVISGLAKGVDGYAHTACLKAGGYTLAFLGHGVDTCYPREHHYLMEAIIEHGAVISQFPLDTPPHRSNFPKRNHLISAWAEKLLVVEASPQSGALITAESAKRLGRTIYAVPGSIYSRESVGTNTLILEGAKPYLTPTQLVAASTPVQPTFSTKTRSLYSSIAQQPTPGVPQKNSSLEQEVLKIVGSSVLGVEELALRLGQLTSTNNKTFFETLTMMQLDGKIKLLPGGFVSQA